MSNGQARPIRTFLNWSITFESNRTADSNLEASEVPDVCKYVVSSVNGSVDKFTRVHTKCQQQVQPMPV